MADESNTMMPAEDMRHCYENLIVIDAGANLTNKKYSRDLDSVIQRAKDAGEQSVISGNWQKLSQRLVVAKQVIVACSTRMFYLENDAIMSLFLDGGKKN